MDKELRQFCLPGNPYVLNIGMVGGVRVVPDTRFTGPMDATMGVLKDKYPQVSKHNFVFHIPWETANLTVGKFGERYTNERGYRFMRHSRKSIHELWESCDVLIVHHWKHMTFDIGELSAMRNAVARQVPIWCLLYTAMNDIVGLRYCADDPMAETIAEALARTVPIQEFQPARDFIFEGELENSIL